MFPLILSVFLGTVFVSTNSADISNTAPAASSTAYDSSSDEIGTVVQLKGKATATQRNLRNLLEGDPVYLNETIETAADSSLQIEFNDESLFTISASAKIKIDEFIYDESAAQGNQRASVTKGVFRFVSGKIEKINPEKVNIDTPSGTIGIRGTVIAGEIIGEKCFVALEPEEDDTQKHRIIIFNDAGGKRNEVEISEPGFSTVIESKGKAPQPIFQTPQDIQQRFQQQLPPKPQFAQGTKPGDPGRYEGLFDPSRMKERIREKAERQQTSGEEPDGNNGNDKKEIRKKEDQNQNPGGPQPPEGPGPRGNRNGERTEGNMNFSGPTFSNPNQSEKFQNGSAPLQTKEPQQQKFGVFRPSGGNGHKPMAFGSFSLQQEQGPTPIGQAPVNGPQNSGGPGYRGNNGPQTAGTQGSNQPKSSAPPPAERPSAKS